MSADMLAPLIESQNGKYVLRLYVAGSTPQSSRALTNELSRDAFVESQS